VQSSGGARTLFAQVWIFLNSKGKPQRELNDSRIGAHRGDGSESTAGRCGAIGEVGCRAWLETQVRNGKVWVVGGIEEVGPKLNTGTVLRPMNLYALIQRKIDVELVRAPHNAVGGVSKPGCNTVATDHGGCREASGVDVIVHSLIDRSCRR
jgi:hypothetical protein